MQLPSQATCYKQRWLVQRLPGRVLTRPVPLSSARVSERRGAARAALPTEKGGVEVQGVQVKVRRSSLTVSRTFDLRRSVHHNLRVYTRQAAQVDEDPSPFFEPLLRSFLLGLGAGALFESLHVCMKVRVDGTVCWKAHLCCSAQLTPASRFHNCRGGLVAWPDDRASRRCPSNQYDSCPAAVRPGGRRGFQAAC